MHWSPVTDDETIQEMKQSIRWLSIYIIRVNETFVKCVKADLATEKGTE